MSDRTPKLSIVIPVFNEQENLQELLTELADVLRKQGCPYEIICIDDASTDDSFGTLKQLELSVSGLRTCRLRRHAGQTAALAAGFDQAKGQVIVTMDADLQSDPHDIPALIALLDQGYDVVSGWRRHRKDRWFRRLVSHTANALLARLTGIPLKDSGCTLKAYRRDVLQHLVPYGDMHRIFPAYLAALGSRIGEYVVSHRPRRHGRSKYGLGRTFRVLLDIIAVAFVLRFSRAPIRVFGGIGLFLVSLGMLTGIWVVIRACWLGGIWVSPLIFVGTILVVSGIQCVALGLLGEMLLWTRATDPRGRTYAVEEPPAPRA